MYKEKQNASSPSTIASNPQPPRLMHLVRDRLRSLHYSLRTEETYVHWIKRFIFFHGKRHPRELGAPAVEAFLTHLAVEDKVAASTQNLALSALLFLYKDVLAIDLPWLKDVTRAKRPRRVPTVLTRAETMALLKARPLCERHAAVSRAARQGDARERRTHLPGCRPPAH